MTQQPPESRPTDPQQAGPAVPSGPPPGWTPAPLSGGSRPSVGGRDRPGPQAASEPLGPPPPGSVRIEEFAPPRSKLPLVVTLIALLAAALIWAGTSLRPATPEPEPATPSTPGATPTASGLPFVSPDERYAGRWEILHHQWTDSGLEVEIRIAADRGPVSYAFVAFENDGLFATDAQDGSQQPRFSGLPIQTGESETGWLFFPMARGAATIILTTATGNQMSALPVPG